MNVAIIPARGGSRRIPRKNIRLFHGKPIIAYSIEVARESGLFDHIFVSSDDREILKIARQCGAEALERELRYAQDEVGTQEVMRDALVELELLGVEPQYVCCIYATAPMMTARDLARGYMDLLTTGMIYALVEGWYYWGKATAFGHVQIDVWTAVAGDVEPERYIDINTLADWDKAEQMYAALHA